MIGLENAIYDKAIRYKSNQYLLSKKIYLRDTMCLFSHLKASQPNKIIYNVRFISLNEQQQ